MVLYQLSNNKNAPVINITGAKNFAVPPKFIPSFASLNAAIRQPYTALRPSGGTLPRELQLDFVCEACSRRLRSLKHSSKPTCLFIVLAGVDSIDVYYSTF